MLTSHLTTIFCAPDRPELRQLLSNSLESEAPSRIIKQDRGTTVTLVSLPTGAVVIKHHRLHTWRRWGDGLIHGSPARRAWRGAQLLQAAAVPVPRPLAVSEKWVAGIPLESFYVSEALLSQVPLNVYWQERQHHWSRRRRCAFLRVLAEFLRTLHAAGLYVGDMKDENLLIEEQEEAHWKFYLVDLDRVTYHTSLSQHRR